MGGADGLPACPRVLASDADALVRLVSERIDDGMLREIAGADYGRDIDQHLAPLLGLRDFGTIPRPLQWEPREVLELIRWSEPDDPEWGPGGHGERGHWMRMFASAQLLRCEFDPANIGQSADGQNQTLAALLVSLKAVGEGLEPAAAALVMWAIEALEGETSAHEVRFDEAAFFGTGLLWLIVRGGIAVPEEALLALCEWIAACEAIANRRAHAGYGLPQGPFLLSTTNFNINHSKWRELGGDLASAPEGTRGEAVGAWVAVIGRMLAGD